MKEYLQKRNNESHESYKADRTKTKGLVSNAKRQAWDKFGEKIEPGSKKNNIRYIKNKQGVIQREDTEIMDRWKEYFEELLNVENERELKNYVEVIINQYEDNMHDKLITTEEVKVAIQTLKRGKAAGHDNITTEMLQSL